MGLFGNVTTEPQVEIVFEYRYENVVYEIIQCIL